MDETIMRHADAVIMLEEAQQPVYYITLGKNEQGEEVVISFEIIPESRQVFPIEEFSAEAAGFKMPCQVLVNKELQGRVLIERG